MAQSTASHIFKTIDTIPPLKSESGVVAEDDEGKCHLLNQFFSSVFTKETDCPNRNEESNNKTVNLDKVYFDPSLVHAAIMRLKTNSSPGPDGITPKVLQETSNYLAYPLAP